VTMPIRAENKDRYPRDWPAISRAIRERAGQKCEKCKAPNGATVFRFTNEDYHYKPVYMTKAGDVFDAENGQDVGYEYAADDTDLTGKWVRIILTVAHLDHQPENCDPDNLRAWCQRCHNAYDAPMRRAGIKSRKWKSGLFGALEAEGGA